MYGMVNDAIRGLVLDSFGAEIWAAVCRRAEAPDSFAPLETYDDVVTYRLIDAASAVLSIDASAMMRRFGHYWIHNVATTHYGDLMEKTGTRFVDFLKSLDHMHQRIRATFRHYQPPSFRVLVLDATRLQVDYYSHRDGLLPFVVGLFEGLGEHFQVELNIEHVPDDAHPVPCKRMIITHGPAG